MEWSLKFPVDFRSSQQPVFKALPPLSLYVHLPWCTKKCPYCDFNSHTFLSTFPEVQYVQALLADLEQALPQIWGRRVQSIFIGGGTPSLFSAEALDQLLSGIRARIRLNEFAEITLEANPGSAETDKFRNFRELGINRLSIGIQSFNGTHLASLGRIHDAAQAREAVLSASEIFDNLNLDLMFALPKQTLDEAISDVSLAVEYKPRHLSFYQLTLEPNTLFFRHPPPLPDDESSFDIEEMIWSKTGTAGFVHYETSAYAQSGFECQHNLNYWNYGDYLGIGAGAHSKLSFKNSVVREIRVKHPQSYMQQATIQSHIQSRQELASEDIAFEFMMNALRLTGGFKTACFSERTGLPFNFVAHNLDMAEEKGWLIRDLTHVRPTRLGQLFLNDLLQLFLPVS